MEADTISENARLLALNAAIDQVVGARAHQKLAEQAFEKAREHLEEAKIAMADAVQQMDHALFQLKSET